MNLCECCGEREATVEPARKSDQWLCDQCYDGASHLCSGDNCDSEIDPDEGPLCESCLKKQARGELAAWVDETCEAVEALAKKYGWELSDGNGYARWNVASTGSRYVTLDRSQVEPGTEDDGVKHWTSAFPTTRPLIVRSISRSFARMLPGRRQPAGRAGVDLGRSVRGRLRRVPDEL